MTSWDQMLSWEFVLPPSRPNEFQITRIREYCREIPRDSKVAILGSTVEFRDLMYEVGFRNIYVLDISQKYYEYSNRSRIYQYPDQLIRGDWLTTLADHQSKFSLVLSDLTSGNIPYGSREKFYTLVEQCLTPNGIFCDKVLTHNSELLELDTLIHKYSMMPLNWLYANWFNCEVLFCSDLIRKNKLVDTSSFYSEIMTRGTNLRINKFIEKVKQITPEGFIWYYGKSWDDLKGSYCPRMKLLEDSVENGLDNPYRHRLHYFFLKKSS